MSEASPESTPPPPDETGPESFAMRRLHPATMIIELMRRLWNLVYFIIVVLLLRFFGRGGGEWHEYVLVGIAVFGAAGAVLRYVTVRYGIEGGRLVLRSGIITRQKRTIPLDRIQNIEFKRGVLHRWMGVVDVQVETAGGVEPEASLSVLALSDAQRLKSELLRRGQEQPGDDQMDTAPPLFQSSLPQLILLGATENRAGLIIGTLAGLWYTFGEAADRIRAPLQQWINENLGDTLHAAFWIAGLVVALVLAGWIVSIVLTTVQYYGFVLRRGEDRLRRRYGLFTQHETTLPLVRIQVLRIDAPLPRRLLGYATMFAETAGSVADRQFAGSTPVCPLIRTRSVGGLLRELLAGIDWERVEWRPVSRLTIRRGFIRYSITGLIIVAVAAIALDWRILAAIPVVLAIAAVAARARYAALGYAEQGDYLLARAGVWTRRTWIVPRGKVQSIDCRQSPFQRRLELASVSISTAAGRGAAMSPTIVDLQRPLAATLQDRLSADAAQRGLWLADGV